MRIAIIDDDQDIINWLSHHLTQEGHQVIPASDGKKGLELIIENEPDVSLVDLMMPVMDGLEVIKHTLETYPQALAVIMTAHASIQTAVEAMKLGAYDYLTKPLHLEEVLMMLTKCREKISLLKENRLLKEQVEQMSRGEIYITQNENIQRLLDQAVNVAATDSTVLITGESGTGKEVFAKYIHKNSQRANKQFVVVNCAALSEQLLEASCSVT